jgi:lactoylglutathione lyase
MKLTDVVPNLIVVNIDASTTFYRDTLGFSVVTTVPDEPPFVFVWLQRDNVSVFLNTTAAVAHDLPGLAARPIGGTAALFVMVDADPAENGVDALFSAIGSRCRVVMPLKDQFYGMREFAIEDPDGYVLTFAQRVG